MKPHALIGALLTSVALAAVPQKSAGLRPTNVEEFGLRGSYKLVLTFDDGPGEGTARILSLLEKYQIEATFFVVGERVQENPELVREARRLRPGGLQNIIGNHSFTHPRLDQGEFVTNPRSLFEEIYQTHAAILAAIGATDAYQQSKGVLFFRAPQGEWLPQDQKLLARYSKGLGPVAQDLGRYYGPIYWDIGGQVDCEDSPDDAETPQARCGRKTYTDAADWECWENGISEAKCMEGYLNRILRDKGGVILSHDTFPQTAAMWDKLLPILLKRGFTFKRLDRIPAIRGVRP